MRALLYLAGLLPILLGLGALLEWDGTVRRLLVRGKRRKRRGYLNGGRP